MIPAWYMRFSPGHTGSPDRVGGLPSHLPPAFPSYSGQSMGFLAQFYCHPERLPLPGALCLQVYQAPEESDPMPVVILVPRGAAENSAGVGIAEPNIRPHDVAWDARTDPGEAEDWQTELAKSKAGGVCYFFDYLNDGERLLLQLNQNPCGLNFGGYSLVLATDADMRLRVAMG